MRRYYLAYSLKMAITDEQIDLWIEMTDCEDQREDELELLTDEEMCRLEQEIKELDSKISSKYFHILCI